MFLPTTPQEIKRLGWDRPDIILVTGDTYIDSPHIGVAVIGKYLTRHGFKTALIAQPSIADGRDILRLGEPKLFWGITAGCIDSMVANYTPSKKRRRQDDTTPGGGSTMGIRERGGRERGGISTPGAPFPTAGRGRAFS